MTVHPGSNLPFSQKKNPNHHNKFTIVSDTQRDIPHCLSTAPQSHELESMLNVKSTKYQLNIYIRPDGFCHLTISAVVHTSFALPGRALYPLSDLIVFAGRIATLRFRRRRWPGLWRGRVRRSADRGRFTPTRPGIRSPVRGTVKCASFTCHTGRATATVRAITRALACTSVRAATAAGRLGVTCSSSAPPSFLSVGRGGTPRRARTRRYVAFPRTRSNLVGGRRAELE